ncbi:MAG: DUF1553 domain-containing protein [Planctomycetes bacterium]|nr:DUF1553 domain-containing protein [Planctomycetota bacterium]
MIVGIARLDLLRDPAATSPVRGTNQAFLFERHNKMNPDRSLDGMRKTCLKLAVVFMAFAGGVATAENAPNIYESTTSPAPVSKLDKIVFAKLASLKIQPVLCSDAVFVRRAYLDVIGTLPTAKEAREFIADPDTKNKRRILIERLLERDEFADYWSMKWGDVLRIKAEFPINLWPNAAQAYHRWVRASIVENKPYDQFVREMLTSSGSNFRVGPVNFYRGIQNKTPEGIATAAALAFMGARAESWPTGRLSGTAVFFSQIGYKPTSEWKEESVFWDPLKSATLATSVAPGQAKITTTRAQPTADDPEKATEPPAVAGPLVAVFPDGTKIELPSNQDPREIFADWLITPENPWFTRSIVNRVWAWLIGRGIIHEPDDIRDDNRPANPELLDYLEKELIAHDYDLKHLYRLILMSNTYQLSSLTRFDHPQAEANFATYPLRRLEAEVLIDAVNKITGTTDLYTSAIPEPFTYIPKDQPAIALADGSITSPFLTLFGRSARATGTANERINTIDSAQWLHLLNSSHIQSKLEQGPAMKALIASGRPPAEIVKTLYLTILSREPTAEELRVVAEYVQATLNRRNAAIDIAWSLINSPEFLYRH